MYPTTFPGITFQEIYIHEPGGLITDLLIALVCLAISFKTGRARNDFERYWKLFIVMIGYGALGGALVHGIPTVLGPQMFYAIWVLKNVFIPVGNVYAAFIVLNTLYPQKQSLIEWGLWAKAGLACVAMIVSYSFTPIIVDLAITYLIVLGFSQRLRRISPAYKFIQWAFLIAFLSGFLYIFKVEIDPLWFSYKDLAHIFVIISVYLIYRGIQADRKPI